jgi:AcrR family transcriptional regulator
VGRLDSFSRNPGGNAGEPVETYAHVQYLERVQSLRDLHKDERRAQILRAARDLVADGGLDALTMRAVAQRARLSVPTVYNLVGSRADVVAALLDAGGDQLDALLVDSHAGDPVGRVVAASDALATVVTPNVTVVTAVLAGGVPGDAGEGGLFGRYGHVTRTALADARAAGVIERRADPGLLADRVVALAAGAVLAWATDHRDDGRLRDDLVHGAMVVLVAHATDDHRARLRRELDRRARRLITRSDRSAPRRDRHAEQAR